ncbi:hypothetical protein BSKO_13226 [Bryopsis sp. KO-2023]|nr:hypothetical protein BSKO_13226 [Bryopsis sp. KO-2023]
MKKSGSRAYNVWTEKEEQALRNGVKRYGVGAWEMIRQDKNFAMLKKRSGVQLKDKWRNLVKFRKLDEEELRNLPTRASGPWSRRQRGRSQDQDENENEEGYQNRQLALINIPPTRAGLHNEGLENEADELNLIDGKKKKRQRKGGSAEMAINDADDDMDEDHGSGEMCGSGDRQLVLHKGSTSDDSGFVKEENEEEGDAGFQRRSGRTCGRSPLLFTDYLTDFEEPESRAGNNNPTNFARRSGNKRSNARLEDRRYGIYDVRRYMYSLQNEAHRTSTNDSTTITNDTSDNELYVVDCPCGVTFDDGDMMIECECCKTWAHVDCLKAQMDQDSQQPHYDFDTYLCDKCQSSAGIQVVQPAPDQGSSISDEDIWHPLALALVPKGKRLPRRRRSDSETWCSWLRPLYPHGFPPNGALGCGPDMEGMDCKEENVPMMAGFGPGAYCGYQGDVTPCMVGVGGMSVSMAAHFLTEQIRHWMEGPSGGQLMAALSSMDQQRMLIPAFPYAGGIGFLPPGMAPPHMAAGLIPEAPDQKKLRMSQEMVESEDYGGNGQGSAKTK